jgi:hypothetical protein
VTIVYKCRNNSTLQVMYVRSVQFGAIILQYNAINNENTHYLNEEVIKCFSLIIIKLINDYNNVKITLI